jgi:hypothetical protein
MNGLYKYPRTPHLPWSEKSDRDDKVLADVDHFAGQEVVVTEKMDGECTSMYCIHYHARSLNSKNHPSRNLLKQFHASIRHNIPEGWRLCGENVYAKHSIFYDRLTAYFYLIGVYDGSNGCLAWDETVEWAGLFDIPTVPVLYRGIWDEKAIKSLWPRRSCFGDTCEGYVVRTCQGFAYGDFARHVAKYVRPNHVQTSVHWMEQAIVPNQIGGDHAGVSQAALR